MNITCTICNDLVSPSETVCVTKCGHVFHQRCLLQWTECSPSCPQCRARVSDREMFRMYPTLANAGDADPAALQSRLDSAELSLREERTRRADDEEHRRRLTDDLEKTKEALRKTEKKLVSCESAVGGLKNQLAMCRSREEQVRALTEEKARLERSLSMCESVQRVISSSTAEVDEMLKSYTDVHTLALFAVTLKKALVETEQKKRESRKAMVQAQRELTILTNKLRESERLLMRATHNQETEAAHDRAVDTEHNEEAEFTHNEETDTALELRSRVPPDDRPASSSPYLMLRRGHTLMNAFSFKPSEQMYLKYGPMNAERAERLSPEAGYDGLGGHTKPDNFPRVTIPTLTKKHKLKNPLSSVSSKRHK